MENKKIQIVCPPHTRADMPNEPAIKPVPKTEEEFYEIVNNMEFKDLKEYGFRKWDTMNNIVKENIAHRSDPSLISIPVFTLDGVADAINDIVDGNAPKPSPSGSMMIDLGDRSKRPMHLLEEDEDIVLFPEEWYNIIPDGFMATDINGIESPFKKGVSDDDCRFGCLAYGIRRKTNKK